MRVRMTMWPWPASIHIRSSSSGTPAAAMAGSPLYSISDLGSSEAMHSDASIAEREAALKDFHNGLSSLRSLT